jgi:hypothetical protein
MSIVRTSPRPRNLRSSSSASARPSTTLMMTTVAVRATVVRIDSRSAASLTTVW